MRRRRGLKTRIKIRKLNLARLVVNKSNKHLYAQLIIVTSEGDSTIVSASTLDAEIKVAGVKAKNVKAAAAIGNIIAKRALASGIKYVAFDRSGFKYHGCIKVLADAAREGGLQF